MRFTCVPATSLTAVATTRTAAFMRATPCPVSSGFQTTIRKPHTRMSPSDSAAARTLAISSPLLTPFRVRSGKGNAALRRPCRNRRRHATLDIRLAGCLPCEYFSSSILFLCSNPCLPGISALCFTSCACTRSSPLFSVSSMFGSTFGFIGSPGAGV